MSSSVAIRRSRIVSATLILTLGSSLGVVNAPASADDVTSPGAAPVGTLISDSVPTVFAESDGPTLGEVRADGVIPVESGVGKVAFDVDPGDGIAVEGFAGAEFAIAGVGETDAGVAGDRAVLYRRADGSAYACRPTADGGVECVDEVASGGRSLWDLDIPEGTHLELLDTGAVAVIRDGAEPAAEVAAAVDELQASQQTILEGALDNLDAAQADVVAVDGLLETTETPTEPVVDDLLEEDLETPGDVPAWLAPDAPIEDLEAAVANLEEGLTPADYSEADLALIDATAKEAADAAAVEDAVGDAEDAAVDAATIDEMNTWLEEDLAAGDTAANAAEVSAELDIADPDDEQNRSVAALIEAQAEIGDFGRVEAVFAAPLSKSVESNTPVATTLEIVAPDRVAVIVPEVGETVAVDPFFVPLLLAVVRVVVQRVAPAVVRAASDYLRRKAAESAARVIAAQNRARQVLAAAKEAARAQAQSAYRAQLAARAKAAAEAKRVADIVAKAKQAAQRFAQQVRAKAAQVKRAALEKAAKAAEAVAKTTRAAVKRVASVVKPAVKTVTRAVQTGQKTASGANQAIRTVLAEHPVVAAVAKDAVTQSVVEAALDALDVSACYQAAALSAAPNSKPATWVSSLFLAMDVVECVQEVDDAGSTAASEPAQQAYDDAQDAASDRATTFTDDPSAPLSARFVGWAIPAQFAAGHTAYVGVKAINDGRPIPLDSAGIHVADGLPFAASGVTDGGTRMTLQDENADGTWSTGEIATGVFSLAPPNMRSESLQSLATFISAGQTFGASSNVPITIVGPPVPPVPQGLTVAPGNGSVTVRWSAQATSQTYRVALEGSTAVKTTTSSSLNWTGLKNGTGYRFRVAAGDALGYGAWTAYVAATPRTVPGTVAKPSATSANNAITLRWPAPSNGGSTIGWYELIGSSTRKVSTTSTTLSLGQDGGLKSWRVRACNAAGCGPYSTASTSVRAKTLQLKKGSAAPHSYWYSVVATGVPNSTISIVCYDGRNVAFGQSTSSFRLASNGYLSIPKRCYSGYSTKHWVAAGSLKSNVANF